MTSIAVIGAGAWGTTIANILADNGVEVLLWCYKQELADAIAMTNTHHRLPGVVLNKNLKVTTEFSDCYSYDVV
ncbi:MAG: 2-dehydropantoate 2-reductase N-terminal domain-containing protein, partial [Candidatus Margulisiibacteriota bacterium]|nr:2-dehydropantoate 2-reductase N-terminal domain-containing protein [Candidatus Margulisiibacteriota bacterium]